MTAKKYAISNPSAAIALRYGKNVSKGILKMEDIIKGQQVAIELFRPKKHSLPDAGFGSASSGPGVRGRK